MFNATSTVSGSLQRLPLVSLVAAVHLWEQINLGSSEEAEGERQSRRPSAGESPSPPRVGLAP